MSSAEQGLKPGINIHKKVEGDIANRSPFDDRKSCYGVCLVRNNVYYYEKVTKLNGDTVVLH